MKTLKCDFCQTKIEGENFDSWFKAVNAHWTSKHADVLKAIEGKPEGEEWVADAKKKFEAA
jgi:hypothetical protein